MTAGVARGQGVLLLSALGGMAASLALTAVAGRHAGPADFGLFALVALFVALARDLTDLGTTAVAVRTAARDAAAELRAIEDLLAWRLSACLALAIAAGGFAVAEADPLRRLILAALAGTIILSHQNALFAVFQLRQAFIVPALINLAGQAAALVVALAVAARGLPGVYLAGVLVVREVALVAGNRVAALRRLGRRPSTLAGLRRVRRRPGATSVYSLAVLLFHAALFSGNVAVLLGVGRAAFGVFSAAFRPMMAAFSLAFVLAVPLAPVFARAAASGDLPVRWRGAWLLATGGAAVVAVIGAILAPDLLDLLYAGRFSHDPVSAVGPLRVLMVALVGVAGLAVAAPAMLARDREADLLRLAGVTGAITLMVAVLGRHGIVGAAWSCVAAAALPALACALGLVGGDAIPVADWGRASAPAAVAGGILWLVPLAGPARIAVGSGLAAAGLLALWFSPAVAAGRDDRRWPMTGVAARG